MTLTVFDPQVTPILPIKFRVNWSFCSGEDFKIDFQDDDFGGHLRYPIRSIILAYFDLQVTPMLPTKFRFNHLSVQEKK